MPRIIKALSILVVLFTIISVSCCSAALYCDRDLKRHCAEWDITLMGSEECIGTTCVHITRQVEKCVRRDDERD